jgi:hypothetical protein
MKPHDSVSKQTVGRWIKITMLKAGIQEYVQDIPVLLMKYRKYMTYM